MYNVMKNYSTHKIGSIMAGCNTLHIKCLIAARESHTRAQAATEVCKAFKKELGLYDDMDGDGYDYPNPLHAYCERCNWQQIADILLTCDGLSNMVEKLASETPGNQTTM